MSYLAALAANISTYPHYWFDDVAEQIAALTNFLEVMNQEGLRFLLTDPDWRRNELRENYWKKMIDSPVFGPLLDEGERKSGYRNTMEAFWDNCTIEIDAEIHNPDLLIDRFPLTDDSWNVDDREGTVNGQPTKDLADELLRGLSPDQAREAGRAAGTHLESVARGGKWLRIDLSKHFATVVLNPRDFYRDLGIDPTPMLDRGFDANHGGFQRNRTAPYFQTLDRDVPHAREQLLRHLLRYAR